MAEHFGFFDAVQDSNGNYDREYNAEQFTVPFDALVTNGIVRSAYEQLEVTTSGANMISTIKSGVAFIEGHHYFNDGIINLTHDVEVLGMDRIDRIVIRKDSNPDARYVKAFIRKGLPSTNPVPPTLTRDENIYEISLAQVRVIGGQGFISSITDERGTVNIGPWAGSDILPSFNDNLLAQHVENALLHLQNGERTKWNEAYTAMAAGRLGPRCATITNWNDALLNGWYMGSGAANAPAGMPGDGVWFMGEVKSHNDMYIVQKVIQFVDPNRPTFVRSRLNGVWGPWRDESWSTLFQSVSNGKSLVANAIRLRGVPTADNAEFATMAANILNLTGRATGSRTVAANGILSVDGLTFAPKVVFATIGEGEYAGHIYVEKISTAKGYVVGIQDGAAQMQPGQPPVQVSPVYIRHKADAVFTGSSFSIPIIYEGLYTWYAYG